MSVGKEEQNSLKKIEKNTSEQEDEVAELVCISLYFVSLKKSKL
jgi:hypothetical protein